MFSTLCELLLIYLWLCWAFIVAPGLSLVVQGFLIVVASLLQSTGSRCTGFQVVALQFVESSWTRD